MNLIPQIDDLHRAIVKLHTDAHAQQHQYYVLITGMVRLHQEYRLAKNYPVSDAIRTVLNDADIEIIQGTDGYAYDQIPQALRGRQINDTWQFLASKKERL